MDLEPIIRTATRAAYQAGRILNSHFGKIEHITKKGVIDLVTEADTASEAVIIKTIKEAYPEHAIMAEESGVHHGRDGGRWIIDPLDGTTNFAHNLNFFCVSIAFSHNDELLVGLVLNPADGELYLAAKNQGATLNKHPIHVSKTADIGESLLATGFPYDVRQRTRPLLARLRQCLLSSQGIRRLGAAALDLCYVAAGRMEGFWEEGLKPWDMAAGALIVQEAGGKVTDFNDRPFHLDQKEMLASNGLIHNDMLKLLRDEESE